MALPRCAGHLNPVVVEEEVMQFTGVVGKGAGSIAGKFRRRFWGRLLRVLFCWGWGQVAYIGKETILVVSALVD
jgi:hypothetical protein